jgi:RNA polymerase sigma-70 factor, ECF subfamily
MMQADHTHILAGKLLENRDRLFAYILSMVRDWQTAEEIFQEVSVTVLRKAQNDMEIVYFGSWFREIARRSILDFWKREKRTHLFLKTKTLDILDTIYAKHEEDARETSMEGLRLCLDRLPDRLRWLIDLRYQSGLSMKDIADKAGMSPGHVQVTLSRTRLQLLDCMKKEAAK